MTKEIIINSTSTQTRVAITEDGNLVDFFVDYPENRRMVGDIYLGRVARVLPGIRAAFIDIGLKHDAFLHFSDIGERTRQFQEMLGEDDSDVDDEEEDESTNGIRENSAAKTNSFRGNIVNGQSKEEQTIIPKLHKGQEILVQIIKEPVNNKGVRVTSSISLPGRFCVLLPFDNKIGISKRISDFRERKRLRYLAKGIIPKNYGLIIRTVARSQTEEALREDLNNLLKTWEEIQSTAKSEAQLQA
jgi:ribonuclease G